MNVSWTRRWSDFKSPVRVLAQVFLVSRQTWKERCRQRRREWEELDRRCRSLQTELVLLREQNRQLQVQVQRLEIEKHELQWRGNMSLPADPPVGSHGYGARMVSLSVNLAQAVGLRGSAKAMKVMFEWLGVSQTIPHYTSIRGWIQRVGLGELAAPVERPDDGIWIADHSNQIGAEKVLVILGIRASQLPPPGEAIKQEDIRLLMVRPGTSWKREDVAAAYRELEARTGLPRAILCDGAVELREGAAGLKTGDSRVLVLHDFKHKAANLLKALWEKNERFVEFNTRLGQTRSSIQQTQLAHLTPPSHKQKARFMNLGRILDWGAMTLDVLERPEAAGRQDVKAERLEEKLGWLRTFADDLPVWRACQQIVESGVTFINQQGVFRGAAARLRRQWKQHMTYAASRTLAGQLMEFVRHAERQLKKGERLPMSSEIIESCFARYKQLEGQHAKEGFTSLLAGFGALLKPATPASVRRAFAKIKKKDVDRWVQHHLGPTPTAKRLAAYKDFKQHQKRATKRLTTA